MLVAIAALIVALGGTAIAASLTGSSAPLKVCVPTKEGKGLVTPKAGACKKGYTLEEVNREGPEGREGAPGSTIVARVRSDGSVESTTQPTTVSDPVSGGKWTQALDEPEQLIGEVTLTKPGWEEGTSGSCTSRHQLDANLHVEILLNGVLKGVVEARNAEQPGMPETVPIDWITGLGGAASGWLYEPATATSQTLTVLAKDECGYEGGTSSAHFTVDSVSIDVIGVH